ncbi:hypothetical protein IFM89_025805 [Coptis chinensis]|uniref:Ubiquitin-like domain-containing protein n=1 Tax=Coptis chinensis TaxID=261450 RepID=A0A835HHE0_9MAGN|nr:hypothetical protein IFM89_025805 [Coptis chinensis]
MEKKRGAKESSNDRGTKRKLLLEHSEGHVFEYSVDEGKFQMELVNVHVDVKETATVEPAENKALLFGGTLLFELIFRNIMKINMRVMKTVLLEVMESDTIRKLKAYFSETEGVSMMNLKKLFFGANSLDSDKKLVDYDLKKVLLNLFLHSGAKILVDEVVVTV